MKFFIRLLRAMPNALERAHLEWALCEICPLHPDVPYIVNRINTLERQS